jgi:hypothetical protein
MLLGPEGTGAVRLFCSGGRARRSAALVVGVVGVGA